MTISKEKRITNLAQHTRTIKDENTSRGNKYSVSIDMIVIDPEYNVRGFGMTDEEYWAQKDVVDHVNSIANSIKNGLPVARIVVKYRETDSKCVVRDGHHRLAAYKKLFAEGHPVTLIEVEDMKGDDADQTLVLLTSNKQLKLTPVEQATVYDRLRNVHGIEPKEIALRVGKSLSHVYQMFEVFDLPTELKLRVQKKELTVVDALSIAKAAKEAAKEDPTKPAKPPKPKPFKPSAKAVKEVIGLLAKEKFEVVDGMVQAHIPVEIFNQLFEQSLDQGNAPETPTEDELDASETESNTAS